MVLGFTFYVLGKSQSQLPSNPVTAIGDGFRCYVLGQKQGPFKLGYEHRRFTF